MKILKRVLGVAVFLLIALVVSIEGFYQYKINQIQVEKQPCQNTYPSTAHEVLWVYSNEKGEIEIESFSATGAACRFVKMLIMDNHEKHGFSAVKGMRVISGVAREQLMRKTQASRAGRHLDELLLSVWISNHYSKDEVLNSALDLMWFGHNLYGLSGAARFYYGKDANKLTTSEIISLIVIAHSPQRLDPHRYPSQHIARAKAIAAKLKRQWPKKYRGYSYIFPDFLNGA